MKLLLVFFLLYSVLVFSQEQKLFSNFQTELFIGQHIKHDNLLSKSIQGNSFGFLLSYNYLNNEDTQFNNLFNFPKRGYSFLYHNHNSEILGELYAGFRHFTYNLTPKKNNELNLTTGFGIGYVTKKYDPLNNADNFVNGSNVVVGAYLKMQYLQFLKGTNFSFNSSIGIIHISNIAFKNPNLGLNTVTFNLGINYGLENKPLQVKNYKKSSINPIKYNLIFRTGFNESKEINSGLYPFYNVGFYGTKSINNYSTLTAGSELFISEFLKHYNNIENMNDNIFRGGIFIGHELIQNKFSFISHLGYYVYYPKKYESRIYERFGFKYKLSEHLFSEVSLKANLFRAEGLELGIGYKF